MVYDLHISIFLILDKINKHFITDIQPLDDIQSAFETLTSNPNAMKSMIKVSGELA